MSGYPDWLPPVVTLGEHGGDWATYVEAVYAWFKRDFVDDKPIFQGRRLGLKRHPLSEDGKEATFWHMVQEGPKEYERIPDLRRCERIRWPRPIIENDDDPHVKMWRNKRKREERVCLWFERESYLVVLADRGGYILPWTAYPVEQAHRRRKLQKEYEAYWRGGS